MKFSNIKSLYFKTIEFLCETSNTLQVIKSIIDKISYNIRQKKTKINDLLFTGWCIQIPLNIIFLRYFATIVVFIIVTNFPLKYLS